MKTDSSSPNITRKKLVRDGGTPSGGYFRQMFLDSFYSFLFSYCKQIPKFPPTLSLLCIKISVVYVNLGEGREGR